MDYFYHVVISLVVYLNVMYHHWCISYIRTDQKRVTNIVM